MTRSPYLQRLKQRRQLAKLKEQIIFGLVLGWILTLFSGFHYLFVADTNDLLWQILFYVGLILIALGTIIPSVLFFPENLFQKITQPIGKLVFSLILILCYFLLILPVGLVLQSLKGSEPFYAWRKKFLIEVDGWIKWQSPADTQLIRTSAQKRPLIFQPIWVIAYFIRSGNYIFIPVLVFLLIFGLLMFFVQSTGIAPFIYTLF